VNYYLRPQGETEVEKERERERLFILKITPSSSSENEPEYQFTANSRFIQVFKHGNIMERLLSALKTFKFILHSTTSLILRAKRM
jgi:hypothetical protein